ncbi:hypothetical protein GXW74_19815 [Roseomonas eburnea]|uniref:Uncharacterized protein n=1 Tax=Neoroseomonas eburnea TaxID=1346889 RepID=A0A9X9XGB3_9PROT|nr:hypothetical protein [Neoroseomonas eburnea]MBR0682749.1 hypothetical protein [Neoroseomonas eburnea]
MAFEAKNLELLAGGSGLCIWGYKTTDAAADVDTAGYFNGAANRLKVGDLIVRTTFTTTAFTTLSSQGFHTVSANDGSTVDVNDTLAVTATDTD